MMATLTTFFSCSRFSWHPRRVGCNARKGQLRCAQQWTLVPVVASVLVGWPALASADPITLNQDIRRASVFIQQIGGVDQRAADFLTVAESSSGVSGTATLISSISDLEHLTGSGVASLTSAGNANLFSSASSSFVVGFTIAAPHDYSFRGSWTGSGDKMGAAILKTNTGDAFFDALINGPSAFERSGRLPSGAYSFEVLSDVVGTSFSPATRLGSSFEFAFDLQASPTPEPASIFLLGSGLAALAAGIRRRRDSDCV